MIDKLADLKNKIAPVQKRARVITESLGDSIHQRIADSKTKSSGKHLIIAPKQNSETKPSVQNNSALLGFRRWDIDYNNNLLISCIGEIPWQKGVNHAYCPLHSAPDADCHCGFNAWFALGDARTSYSGVLGAVAGAGRVEVHDNRWGSGFRSSEAQILAFLVEDEEEAKRLEPIAAHYGVFIFLNKTDFFDYLKTLPLARQKDVSYKREAMKSGSEASFVIPSSGQKNNKINSKSSSQKTSFRNDLKELKNSCSLKACEVDIFCMFLISVFLACLVCLPIMLTSETIENPVVIAIWLIYLVLSSTINFYCLDERKEYQAVQKKTVGLIAAILPVICCLIFLLGTLGAVKDAKQGVNMKSEITALAVLEEKYYSEHREYTEDPNKLMPGYEGEAKIDKTDGGYKITLEQGDKQVGIKSAGSEIQTACKGTSKCGEDGFSINDSVIEQAEDKIVGYGNPDIINKGISNRENLFTDSLCGDKTFATESLGNGIYELTVCE